MDAVGTAWAQPVKLLLVTLGVAFSTLATRRFWPSLGKGSWIACGSLAGVIVVVMVVSCIVAAAASEPSRRQLNWNVSSDQTSASASFRDLYGYSPWSSQFYEKVTFWADNYRVLGEGQMPAYAPHWSACGIPLRSFWCRGSWASANPASWADLVFRSYRVLPYTRVDAVSLFVNAMCGYLMLLCIINAPEWIRRTHRSRSDRCPACGYFVRDLRRCPECGAHVRRHRRGTSLVHPGEETEAVSTAEH